MTSQTEQATPFDPDPPLIQSGPCVTCGTTVTREVDGGDRWIARMARDAPIICEPCAAAAERAEEEREEARKRQRREDKQRIQRARCLRSSALPSQLARWKLGDLDPEITDADGLAAAERWVAGFKGYHGSAQRSLSQYLRNAECELSHARYETSTGRNPDGSDIAEAGYRDPAGRALDRPWGDVLADSLTAQEATNWAGDNTDRRGLLLTGKVGTGKSTLMAAAVHSVTELGQPIRWIFTPALFTKLSAGFGDEERERMLKLLLDDVPIALDDLDKTKPAAAVAEQLFVAIDSRLSEGVPIAVTTNLQIGELAAKWPEPFGEAIASRLAGYCEIVRIGGDDRRTGS